MAFVDTEQRFAGEVQQKVGRIKLSEAIRIGAREVVEDTSWFGCALCAACHGTGLPFRVPDWAGSGRIYSHLEAKTSASLDILMKVSIRHYRGATTADLIDWLEAQGL